MSKSHIIVGVTVLVALIVYDLFIKKMFVKAV